MLSKLLDKIILKTIWKTPGRALRVYESMPQVILDNFRLGGLKSTLRHAREHSCFYRKKFAGLSVDIGKITGPEALDGLYTTPDDLQTQPADHFLCGKAHTAFETTGTVSRVSKRVFFSNNEIKMAGRVGAAGLWKIGVRPEDRVASSFDYSFWVSGPTLKSSLAFIGAFHVEAGRIDPEEFYERIKPYGCNIIVADPGWLVALSQVAEKRGPWLAKLLIAGGENLTEESRRYVESVWQCPLLLSYGQTEAFGMIGMECTRKDGYHLNDADLWAEIPEPDEDGYGELVYTTLRRSVMPLVRYRAKDVTRLITEPCPCGSRAPRLAKLRGRADDLVVTGVGNIASWMLEGAVEKLAFPVGSWQLAIRKDGVRDHLEFRAELFDSLTSENLREEVMGAMKEAMNVAFMGVKRGLADFSARCYGPGELKGSARKVKRILDERKFD